jgi:hypothetical protein
MPLSKELNSAEMASAIKSFKAWRSSREKMCRIPNHLWQIAANLSTQYHYPLNTICKKLGLNWGDLKKKITQLSSNHPVNPQKSPSFVELKLDSQEQMQPASFLFNHSSSRIPSPSPHCAVELTRSDGTGMKIFYSPSNDAPLDILELCKAFLGNHGRQQ